MVQCPRGFRTWTGLLFGAAVAAIAINDSLSAAHVEERSENQQAEALRSVTADAPGIAAPRHACLALVAQGNLEDIPLRVHHLSKMQHYDFAKRYLVLDTRGTAFPTQIGALADLLVKQQMVEGWMTVDHSQEYMLRVNETAEWEIPFGGQQATGHGISFDDSEAQDVQLAFYFAIDQCSLDYVAVVQLDQIMYSAPNVSWIEDAIQALQVNKDLILVSPSFPGFMDRKLRLRPTTRPIPKLNSGQLKGPVEVEDTTCQHPYTLAGRAAVVDLQRYRQLPPRNHVKEHRCGGQLVRGKPCKSLPFVRLCGGMRTWEAALECVICNSENLQQGTLTNWQRAWSQHAPLSNVRHDVAKLKRDIESIESGKQPAIMGPEYRGLDDLVTFAV